VHHDVDHGGDSDDNDVDGDDKHEHEHEHDTVPPLKIVLTTFRCGLCVSPPGDTGIYIAIDDITIDDGAKDATYLAPAKAKAQYIDTLAKSVKVLPLPKNVTTWSAAEVQKFLRINKLLAFKKPFYANGITGQELFKLKGHNFPSSRFSKKERDAFDAAIAQVNGKVLDTFVDGPFRKTSDVTLLAPPVPARPSQSPTN